MAKRCRPRSSRAGSRPRRTRSSRISTVPPSSPSPARSIAGIRRDPATTASWAWSRSASPTPAWRCASSTRICDRSAEGETGELLMTGPQLTPGLLAGPRANGAAYVTPPGEDRIFYRTGDRVRSAQRRRADGLPGPNGQPDQDPGLPRRARRDRGRHAPGSGRRDRDRGGLARHRRGRRLGSGVHLGRQGRPRGTFRREPRSDYPATWRRERSATSTSSRSTRTERSIARRCSRCSKTRPEARSTKPDRPASNRKPLAQCA